MSKPMYDQGMSWRVRRQPGDDPAPQKRVWASLPPVRARVLHLAHTARVCVCISAVLLSGWGATCTAFAESSVVEWPAYGRDPGGSRYAPLAQITRDNVTQLQVAWTYSTGEANKKALSAGQASFEATPLVIDGTL